MDDNILWHSAYTAFAYCVDHVSTVAAIVLFTMQFIVLAPRVYKTLIHIFRKECK